jgi:hypothetical protein
MGTKEKNTLVKSNSEYAVVSILKLRKDETILKVIVFCYVLWFGL